MRNGRRSVWVCVPTYNEAENVTGLTSRVLAQLERLGVDATVLIIDDASPDGTGAIADRLAASDKRVRVLHRAAKSGLGRAYQAGFAVALRHGADLIVQMDCDFSHDPDDLPSLLAACDAADVVIGSRYVYGGSTVDWPWIRRLISRGGGWYARHVLGISVRDLTGGFKCFRRTALERLPYDVTAAAGYGFQIETTYRAVRAGLRIAEIPITFRDRTEGTSKMSTSIAREAALLVLRLRLGVDVPPRPLSEQEQAVARVPLAAG